MNNSYFNIFFRYLNGITIGLLIGRLLMFYVYGL